MQKWIMLGIAAVTLIITGFVLWLMWVFGGTGLTENLIAPDAYEGEFAEENLKNLQYGLGRVGLGFWGVGVLTGLIWLARSSFANIVSPAHVGRLRGFWWGCFVVGALVALGATYAGLFGSLPDLRRELWVVVLVAMLPLYLVSFWPIGSWLFTRAAVRRAVPGASGVPSLT